MSKYIKKIKNTYKPGMKVKLIKMFEEPQMPEGLHGEIQYVDDIGQIQVNWENGSQLALNTDVDQFIIC